MAIDKLGNLVGCHPKLLMIDTYTDDTRLFIAAPDKPDSNSVVTVARLRLLSS